MLEPAALSGGGMPCWVGDVELATGYDNNGLTALDQDGACRRFDATQPAFYMVRKYRELSGETPTTFTFWAGNPGHSIFELTDDGDTNWPRFEGALDEIIRAFNATPDPMATYGCTELDWISLAMVQGESDEGAPGTNNNYTAEVTTFYDKVQTLHDTLFPTRAGRELPIFWDQPSNWFANANGQDSVRSPVNQQLLDVDRPQLHVIQSKGHANPNMISTNGTLCNNAISGSSPVPEAISFEYGEEPNPSGSTLHWSPCWHIYAGEQFAKWIYRLYYQEAGNDPGFQITGATLDGTDLTVTWNVPRGNMVLDAAGDAGVCPDHWNGNQGFELVNIASPGYFDSPEIPNPPTITSIGAITGGNSITFGLSHAPYLDDGKFGTRFEVCNRGWDRESTRCWGSATVADGTACVTPAENSAECGNDGDCIPSNEPEHGCRDFNNILGVSGDEVNIGAPYPSYFSTDPLTRSSGDEAVYGVLRSGYDDPMLCQSFPLTVGQAVPTDSAPGHIAVSEETEYISCPDEATDVFDGATRMVLSFRVRTDSDSFDNDEIMRKWATMRLIYDRAVGTGVRFSINIGGAANFSAPVATDALPEDSPVFQSIIINYDGNKSVGDRVDHWYDCVDLADTEANIPTSMINSANVLQLGGNRLSNSAITRHKDWAIWIPTQEVTDAELLSICRGDEPDLSSLSVGGVTPAYFIRPSCGDDITAANGLTNLGSVTSDCQGNNHEAGDFVEDGSPACP